ncbi:MFS transporter [Sphaerisporangium corydalis]|uniref:MFS transporter n=1 Tax=Sphaerisporangium corydalis TaxID=1441875 RepID=A0ABV9E6I3_9ACTN|nr:MFS transporter [Sphaerisporangium corydalis]
MGGENPASLWRNRGFVVFLTAQTLSSVGDSISFVALPLLILHATGSVVQMGVVTALAGAASTVTGIFAGVVTDRVDRRTLLLVCDVARCVLYALIPIVWWVSPVTWPVYVVVPLAAAFSMLFQVAYVAVVPRLVEPGQITRANGHLYGTYAVASVGGPMLAGVLSGLWGPAAAIAIDAASFAASAAGILLLRLRPAPEEPPGERPEAGGRRAAWREFAAGARFLWARPVLRSLTVLLSALTFLTFGLPDIIVYHLKHDLGRSDGTVGYVLAFATAGTLAAAVVVAPARRHLGFGRCWIGAWALGGVAVAGIGYAEGVPTVAALATLMLFCTGLAGICSMSLRQEMTPDHLLGRVTSAFWTLHSALGPLGAAALTAGAARFGVAPTCLVAGVACVLVAVSGLLTPVRLPRPETA